MTKGRYDRVDTQRRSQAMTAKPVTNAMTVARIVGPHSTVGSLPIFVAS
jgi:hypothetical protein